MKQSNVNIILIFILLLCGASIKAQDVEESISRFKQRWQEDPLKVSGVAGVYLNTYATSSEINRAAPFAGRLLAALNLDLLGFNAPFTLAMSTGGQAFNYTLPAYSFIGISPSYKWVKMHFGDRTIDLGKYTFSRQSFKGIGTELNPKNLRFRAFYGRIRRARAADFAGIQRVEPFFKRIGWGIQGGYEKEKDKVLVSIFQAWDDPTTNVIPDSSFQFFAGENVIVSTRVSKQIGEKLFLDVDYANSGYTEDRNSPADLSFGFARAYGGLLKTNVSTRWGSAFSAALNLKTGFGGLNFEWERIDPGYKTMGALFFQNDLQNVSIGAKARMLKKKLMLNGRIGIQQNNLSGNQANDYNRFIGYVRLGYQVTPTLTFDAGYSSFNNVNRRTVILDPLNPIPTTELVLSNQDIQLSMNWIISQSNQSITSLQSTLNVNAGQSILNDEVQTDGETQTVNLLFYLTRQILTTDLNMGLSLSHQENTFGLSNLRMRSVGLNLGKQLLDKKMNLQAHMTAGRTNQQFENQGSINTTLITGNFNAGWQLSERNSINLNSMLIVNQANADNADFSEWRNTLAYQYKF